MTESDKETARGEEHLFNIGAVARMTDIHEATLRAWERRYDFPKSGRTAGGHRLYSQQDVLRLKWVKLRVEEGMQVSKAIQALQHLEQEGTLPSTTSASQPLQVPKPGYASLPASHARLLGALFAHDAERANQTLNEASAMFPVEDLIYDVLSPAFFDIGEAWHAGRINVATEHFATHLLRYHLLMWMRTSPPAFHVNPVILACAPGELHEGSLLMLGVLLQRLRWPIVYLGQSTPLASLAPFVEGLEPSVLVLVAMMEEPARALFHWPDYLPQVARAGRPIVGFGGGAFTDQPELANQIPGTFLGHTLQEGIDTLNRLLHELNPLLH
jgi:DNA-binding transcriptional MerR regulator